MLLRRYEEKDTLQLCDIYYNTIHTVNKFDYTKEELEAWAPSNSYNEETYKKDTARWNKIRPFVVEENGVIYGFAELENEGHINCFFVHHEHQGKGVGKMLAKACINEAKALGYKEIVTEVSITAKAFFLNQGFTLISPTLCDISGLNMKYYIMKYYLGE